MVDGDEECDDENPANGDGCSATCQVEPVQIVGLDYRVCALGSNGRIRCFNAGMAGWEFTEVKLGPGEKALTLAAGDHQLPSLCAVLSTGAVRCWNSNHSGKLGLGSTDDVPLTGLGEDVDLGTGLKATSIAVGMKHACAVLGEGKVKCWGHNGAGQLGLPEDAANPSLGDEAGEMGDNLPFVEETVRRGAQTVVAGNNYTCIKRIDQTLRCWGGAAPGAHTPDQEIDLGSTLTVSEASAGQAHACALLTNNALKCWGANNSGQLGQNDLNSRNLPSTMGDWLKPVWLGTGRTAASVVASGSQTCAILDDGTLKCWGSNAAYQLGTGDKADVGGMTGDMQNLPPVDLGVERAAKQVAFGSSTYCALLGDGRVTCWGAVNTPLPTVVGDEPDEMGDKLPIIPMQF